MKPVCIITLFLGFWLNLESVAQHNELSFGIRFYDLSGSLVRHAYLNVYEREEVEDKESLYTFGYLKYKPLMTMDNQSLGLTLGGNFGFVSPEFFFASVPINFNYKRGAGSVNNSSSIFGYSIGIGFDATYLVMERRGYRNDGMYTNFYGTPQVTVAGVYDGWSRTYMLQFCSTMFKHTHKEFHPEANMDYGLAYSYFDLTISTLWHTKKTKAKYEVKPRS